MHMVLQIANKNIPSKRSKHCKNVNDLIRLKSETKRSSESEDNIFNIYPTYKVTNLNERIIQLRKEESKQVCSMLCTSGSNVKYIIIFQLICIMFCRMRITVKINKLLLLLIN